MTHDQLVAALQTQGNVDPIADPVRRVVECEDLFKGAVAILADRAVHVEERLGAITVKGVYPFDGVRDFEVRDEFSGTKEVRMRVGEQSVRLAKVLPADAEALRELFSGAAPPAPTPSPPPPPPVATVLAAPSAPAQATRVSAARAMATAQAKADAATPTFSFRPSAIEAAKVAFAATVVALIARQIAEHFYWQLSFAAQLFVIWTCYAAFGAIGFGQTQRLRVLARYGMIAGAIGAFFGWLMLYFGYRSSVFTLEAMAGWALVSMGAFAARQARASRQQAAGLGAAYGLVEHFLISGHSWIAIYLGIFAFWFLQYLAEHHPQSQLR